MKVRFAPEAVLPMTLFVPQATYVALPFVVADDDVAPAKPTECFK
jgi:hypothetical protein